jgi:hypothetical protein
MICGCSTTPSGYGRLGALPKQTFETHMITLDTTDLSHVSLNRYISKQKKVKVGEQIPTS